VISSARKGSGYDFGPLFEPIQPWIAGADLALCHLEIPIAPEGVAPSGFPLFAAPKEIVPALSASGWDGCSTASNHSVDKGSKGLIRTLDVLEEAGMGHVGTARSAEEAGQAQFYQLEREGQSILVAQISATYGTNGMPVAEPWMVDLIDTKKLISQARRAREAGADIVVASIHCCVEYVTEPTARQREIATALASSGEVDLLIGHHAHVPQPIEKLPGGPRGEGMWVAHGLGNFISNQGPHAGLTARSENGLLMIATFRKPADAPATVETVEWVAITVDRTAGHRVQPLSALRASGKTAGNLSSSQIANRHKLVADAAGTQASERTEPPEPTGPPARVLPRIP
jgi:poly-gamma-glutamate capsule biosynthesis protein CapA/YwtB (metallophosphatase superfamily)